ncbi:MAG: gyrase subunit A protein [Parcubacteria group bacterium GW2011_GWA2_39_18]|nr:MAG: gyrase subunit A protein [Parcubacteria group bacterium GW2011_GWA2_39_18]
MSEKKPKEDNIVKSEERIESQEIVQEMRRSYLDYAMSVIISRALPDVRDGLKPVQRRILYAMHEIGLKHSAKFRKSAAVVGEVMAKYHPHGDASIYDALSRMTQDFSLRYPLVAGQGNFGSLDGDPPAAMRYTEAKLAVISDEILSDIEKNTVDFKDNYDGSKKEPAVLPARLPQLLLNGSMGIAVGMATNIPPHNINEVIVGLELLIDHPKSDVEDLIEVIRGPDFPTGGYIYNKKDIMATYATGRGPIVMRGKADIESPDHSPANGGSGTGKKLQIIITEVPYQVNKAQLIETIANLVHEKRIEGVKDLRDESDKDGLRIALDLKQDAYPQKILNALYKLTDLQKVFHVNALALSEGIQPQTLSLKSLLEQFIQYRKTVVRRRTEYELLKAKERAHILEGLHKALNHIDAIIKTIKSSADKDSAHDALMKKFKFSVQQATAILEMKLQALAGLERKKIEDELKEKKTFIKECESILADEKKILGVIKKEFSELKLKYGDERRTKIVNGAVGEFSEEDLAPEEEAIVILTRGGYIKRLSPDTWKTQKRGGKGVMGVETKEEDVVEKFLAVNTHDHVSFFTNKGRVFQIRAFEIPEGSRTSRGKALVNLLNLGPEETVSAAVSLREKPKKGEKSGKFFVMMTQNGIIKRTSADEFSNIRSNGLISITLDKNDLLKWVKISSGADEIICVSEKGQAIRFSEKDVRTMGRSAKGVRGMKLRSQDRVVSMDVLTSEEVKSRHLLVVSENGFGKRTELKSYKKQKRGGIGIKTANVTQKTGNVVSAIILQGDEEECIAISQKGQVVRTNLKTISVQGRATQGVRLMRLSGSDKVASVTFI